MPHGERSRGTETERERVIPRSRRERHTIAPRRPTLGRDPSWPMPQREPLEPQHPRDAEVGEGGESSAAKVALGVVAAVVGASLSVAAAATLLLELEKKCSAAALCWLAALAVVIALVKTRRLKWPVWLRWSLVVVAAALLVGGGAQLLLAGDHGDSRPPSSQPPAPAPATPVLIWISTAVDPAVKNLVTAGSQVWQWGGRSLILQGGALRITVPAPIDDVTPCGRALLVTFGAGLAARYGRRSGRQISQQLRVSNQPAKAVCGWGSAFFTVPRGNGWSGGYVLRARASDLAVQAKIDVGGRLGGLAQVPADTDSSVTEAGGADRPDTLMVGDLEDGTVANVDVLGNYVRDVTPGLPEPRVLLHRRSAVLVLEQERGCLRKIAAAGVAQANQSAAVPAPLVAVAHSGDSLMVLYAGGRKVQRLSFNTLKPLGPPLALARGVRGSDVLAVSGGWEVLDGRYHQALTVSADDEKRMETAALGNGELKELAPCR